MTSEYRVECPRCLSRLRDEIPDDVAVGDLLDILEELDVLVLRAIERDADDPRTVETDGGEDTDRPLLERLDSEHYGDTLEDGERPVPPHVGPPEEYEDEEGSE